MGQSQQLGGSGFGRVRLGRGKHDWLRESFAIRFSSSSREATLVPRRCSSRCSLYLLYIGSFRRVNTRNFFKNFQNITSNTWLDTFHTKICKVVRQVSKVCAWRICLTVFQTNPREAIRKLHVDRNLLRPNGLIFSTSEEILFGKCLLLLFS